jgi:tetratricopeptide (TPR) repeat protein
MGFARTTASVLVFASLLATIGTVHAQPPTTGTGTAEGEAAPATSNQTDAGVAEARRRYAQGAEFYRRNRYAEAVAEFTEAYRLWQNPTILYALGQAYEGLSQLTQAIRTYQLYLEISPPEDVRRGEVQARIEQLEALLATVRIDVNVPAEIFVDGEPSGVAPGTVRVSTGRHVVEVRAEGHSPDSQTIIVAAGTEREIRFNLRAVSSGTTEIIRVERDERRGLPRPVFYAVTGVAGASFVTWGSLSLVALRRANQYNDRIDRNPADRAAAREWQRRSDIMLGVTGGLAVGAVLVGVFTRWHEDDEEDAPTDDVPAALPAASVEVSPSGAALQLRWAL